MSKVGGKYAVFCFAGVVSAAVLFLSFILSLKFGAVDVSWKSIVDFLASKGDPLAPDIMILRELRFPRTLCAMISGAAFAVSGAVLQGVLRNPLASPEINGVSAGGGVAGLTAMLFFSADPHTTVWAVFGGSLLISAAVYFLAWKNGVDPLRLILSGVAFSSLCGAAGSAMMYLESDKASQVLAFAVGSLSMRSNVDVAAVFPFAVCGFALAWSMSKRLDILQLGDDTAYSLGVSVEKSRALLLLSSVLLAATGVSLAGLLGFAGLVVPHVVRLLFRSIDSRRLIFNSAVAGAVFVTLCDTAGKSFFAPIEIPAGVLTSLAGPPFFLWLLFRKS